MNRTVRTVSLLTIVLFLMSASINATLDRIETSPGQSELTVFANGGYEKVYHGDIARLAAIDATLPRPAFYVHRMHVTVVQREYRWL